MLALIAGRDHFEGAAETVVDDQHSARVVEFVAVVWCRKNGHEFAPGEEFVAVRDDLVCSADKIEIVRLEELVHYIRPENVGYAAVALGPTLTIGVWIRPKQIAEQTFIGYVSRSADVFDLV